MTTKCHVKMKKHYIPMRNYTKYNLKESWIICNQIKLIDNEKRHIVTNYTGKRANILKLKAGDYIKIEAIVKSHEEIDGIPVTLVSHIKNLSS